MALRSPPPPVRAHHMCGGPMQRAACLSAPARTFSLVHTTARYIYCAEAGPRARFHHGQRRAQVLSHPHTPTSFFLAHHRRHAPLLHGFPRRQPIQRGVAPAYRRRGGGCGLGRHGSRAQPRAPCGGTGRGARVRRQAGSGAARRVPNHGAAAPEGCIMMRAASRVSPATN